MPSATIAVTQQNIAAREAAVLHVRAELRRTPARSPRHEFLETRLRVLLTEIEALRASLHYYKPSSQLELELLAQRKKVAALTAALKTAKRRQKWHIARQLRAETKTLRQMAAAAQIQMNAVQPTNPLAVPVQETAPSLTVVEPTTEDLGAGDREDLDEGVDKVKAAIKAVAEKAASTPVLTVIQGGAGRVGKDVVDTMAKLDAALRPGQDEEVEKPFYTRPLFLFGLGLVVGGLIFNR